MSHTLAFGGSRTACGVTCSPPEGFLGKSVPVLFLRTVTVKEALPSSMELLCVEGLWAQRDTGTKRYWQDWTQAGFHSFKEMRL